MKKNIFFLLLFLGASLAAYSQEIQLHFDPRHALHSDVVPRNYVTATFQMFKADKWGSTFGFIDMDLSAKKGNIGLAYLEISRNFKIKDFPIMPHIEFNGGIGKSDTNFGYSIPNAYLVGAAYGHSLGKLNLETYVAYKYNSFHKTSHDVQWTVTWNINLLDNKITLTGFMDLWTENKDRELGKGGKKVILMSEPQFWYNVDKHLAFGSEIEITNNFYADYKNKPYILPTIAAKWTF